MSDRVLPLSRQQRLRLLDILNKMPLFDTVEGRDLLLADLPEALIAGLQRSTIKSVDLEKMVRVAEAWGNLDDNTPAMHILLENTQRHSRGSEAGRNIEA